MDEPLSRVLGGKSADRLEQALGLRTVGDLLRHYPRRYAERGQLTDLDRLEPNEHVTVLARVKSLSARDISPHAGRSRRMTRMLTVHVTDGRGELELTWFGRTGMHERALRPGRVGLFAGKVTTFRGRRQLTHPEYKLTDAVSDVDELVAFADAIIPVYPASAQLPTWRIQDAVRIVLDVLRPVQDPLPEKLRTQRGLLPLADALRLIHQPRRREDIARARDRLRWDEAFVLQALLAQRRLAAAAEPATPRRPVPDGLLAAFDARLPFTLTPGQREVGAAIEADLAGTTPMNRLLQGEVGSGKTLVALRAMLTVVDNGAQAALLAPTEVLAQQHARSIRTLLGPLAEGGLLGGAEQGTRVALLTGSMSAGVRRQALLDIASGEAGIVVGTHALLEEGVFFFDLGMVVVDEQHRFGVEQRDALRTKSVVPPHVLVMTATPIPRTVAMTAFGDLEVSELAELPAGRAPIVTHVVPAGEKPHFLNRAWQRVREEVAAGRQAYIVCPRIGEDAAEEETGDEPPADDATGRRPPLAVLDVAPLLLEGPLQGLRGAVLHGRLPPDDKERVMQAFTAGEVDVLLATTVIEVGVDVPNATVMVVLDADRFGISQLHQLRGRVGRGEHPGLCLLVSELPDGSPPRARLDAVAATGDGFELSRLDLEFRREGDVLGAAQSGTRSSLRLLSVLRDEKVLLAARHAATEIVREDPELAEHAALRRAISQLVDDERAQYLEKA